MQKALETPISINRLRGGGKVDKSDWDPNSIIIKNRILFLFFFCFFLLFGFHIGGDAVRLQILNAEKHSLKDKRFQSGWCQKR